MYSDTTKVVLPEWLSKQAGDNKEELKQLIVKYMSKNYPNYKIIKVKNGFAICEIDR